MSVKVEKAIQHFVELRDKRAKLKQKYEEMDFKLKEDQAKIENWLLKQLNEQGVESFKTVNGTAYISTENRASCADWPNFWGWCAENQRIDMLEKRVSSKTVMEYQEEHKELPPFINLNSERVVRVRRI